MTPVDETVRVAGVNWEAIAGAEADPFAELSPLSDAEDDAPIDFYCPGLCLAPSDGKISLIAGDPGNGKGPLVDYLAACFALGAPAFGRFPCRKLSTLILDCEGARLTRRRIRRMTKGLGRDQKELDNLFVRDVSGQDITTDAFCRPLRSFLEDEEIRVLVVDSYTNAMLPTGLDIKDPNWALFARRLGGLGILVLLVAHTRKLGTMQRGERPMLGDIAGTFALASLAATAICVWRTDADRDVVNVGCLRSPEKDFADFEMRFTDGAEDALKLEITTGTDARRDVAQAERDALATKAERVLAHLQRNPVYSFSKSALRTAASTNTGTIDRVLSALVRADILENRPDPRGKGDGTYVLRNPQGTPRAVVFDEHGECRPAKAGPGSVGAFTRGRQVAARPRPGNAAKAGPGSVTRGRTGQGS